MCGYVKFKLKEKVTYKLGGSRAANAQSCKLEGIVDMTVRPCRVLESWRRGSSDCTDVVFCNCKSLILGDHASLVHNFVHCQGDLDRVECELTTAWCDCHVRV